LFGLSAYGTAQTASAAAEATAPAGFRLDPDGTLVHEGSGTRFPHSLAGFTRVAEQGYDPSGQYVSVEYRSPVHGSMIVARISLVHIEQMCGSACKRDPRSGVIGVQEGPLISMV